MEVDPADTEAWKVERCVGGVAEQGAPPPALRLPTRGAAGALLTLGEFGGRSVATARTTEPQRTSLGADRLLARGCAIYTYAFHDTSVNDTEKKGLYSGSVGIQGWVGIRGWVGNSVSGGGSA